MSRGCIGPASKAARPASIACAKARAIATGSPALATAVLSSTRVIAELHRGGGVRGQPEPGVDDQRHIGEMRAQGAQAEDDC